MTTEIISNYKSLASNIGQLIEVSGYRNDFIAKKIGIQPQTFSVKKGRKSFTVDEIEKIIKVIDNEEVEDFMMLEILRSRKDDENLTGDEFNDLMGWK
jgi:predicted transcriptional regulator